MTLTKCSLTLTALALCQFTLADNPERALIAYMKVKPGTEKEFLGHAEKVITESRKESGNLRYQLHHSVANPQQFVFYELFKTDADLQYHRRATHTQKFLKDTKPITLEFVLEQYVPEGSIEDTQRTAQSDRGLNKEVLSHWDHIEKLMNKAGDVELVLDKGSLNCLTHESLEGKGLVGSCTFSAAGAKDAIDVLGTVSVGDPKKGDEKAYTLGYLSILRD